MKNKCLVYTFAIILLSGLFQTAHAQQGQIWFDSGISVLIKVEKNGSEQNLSNIFSSSGTNENIVHRVVIDKKNKLYVGYDLEITPTAEISQFDVLIKPLSLNKDMSDTINKLGDSSNLSLRSIPKYPGKITVQDGDTISLDVLENPQTGEKISDLIKITWGKQKFDTYFPNKESPRDFTINDVQLSLNGFEAYVNEEKVKFSGGGMSGSVIWIYFPNKGRFILSAIEQNNSGFQKIGIADDKTITFKYEGENYKFVSNNPVLAGGGKWNLWVMFDKNYKPFQSKNCAESSFTFGAANKVELLFDNK
jgi:hypothetical protein